VGQGWPINWLGQMSPAQTSSTARHIHGRKAVHVKFWSPICTQKNLRYCIQFTRYELDGPGIESQWGRDFQHTSLPALPWGPPSLLHNRYRVSIPGVKRPVRDADHPPTVVPKYRIMWGRKYSYLNSQQSQVYFS